MFKQLQRLNVPPIASALPADVELKLVRFACRTLIDDGEYPIECASDVLHMNELLLTPPEMLAPHFKRSLQACTSSCQFVAICHSNS